MQSRRSIALAYQPYAMLTSVLLCAVCTTSFQCELSVNSKTEHNLGPLEDVVLGNKIPTTKRVKRSNIQNSHKTPLNNKKVSRRHQTRKPVVTTSTTSLRLKSGAEGKIQRFRRLAGEV